MWQLIRYMGPFHWKFSALIQNVCCSWIVSQIHVQWSEPLTYKCISALYFKVKWINCDLPKYYLWYRKLLCRMKKKFKNKPKHVWTIYVWRTVFLFNDLTFLCLTKNLVPLNQYAACKSNLLEDSNFIQGVNQLTIDKKNPWFICK